MLRKVIEILAWAGVAAYLAIALAFTDRMESTETVSRICVKIMDSTEIQFIDREDVINILKLHGLKITGVPADSINRAAVRLAVNDIPEVKCADVYYTPGGNLHIRIWQRKPVVRIKSGRLDYYLDEDNYPWPFSPRFTPKVLVITGSDDVQMVRDKLFEIAVYIRDDSFLNALVQEIHIDQKGKLEITPRVGSQRIFMGYPEDYAWKLAKLKVFYEKAVPSLGWDKYSLIDVQYSDQVVCTRIEEQISKN